MPVRLILILATFVLVVLGGAVLLLDMGPESGESPGTAVDFSTEDDARAMPLDGSDDEHAGQGASLSDLAGSASPLEAEAVEQVVTTVRATGTVSGRVVDERGVPISGAPLDLIVDDDPWVTPFERSDDPLIVDRTESDRDGRFRLSARAGTSHVLLAGGLRHARTRLEMVAAGDELVVTLESGLAIAGVVIAEETGEPVVDAWVGAIWPGDGVTTRTDGMGAFSLGPLPAGTTYVGAVAPGFDVEVLEGVSTADDALTVELPPGRVVTGPLTDHETKLPIEGALVTLVVPETARPAFSPDPLSSGEDVFSMVATTDELGVFMLPAAPSRGFRIEVHADGYLPLVSTRYLKRTLRENQTIPLELRPERDLVGTVLHDESPMAGAAVRLRGGGLTGVSATSDADGRFVLPLAGWDGEGRVAVEARVAGFDAGSGDLFARHLLNRKDDELELELVERLLFDVLVTVDGLPGAGAQVAATSDHAETSLADSGPDGIARIEHFVSGADIKQVRLTARREDAATLSTDLDLTAEREPGPIVIALDAGQHVTGQVTNTAGMPLAGAFVTGGGVFERADAEGRFDLFPLKPSEKTFPLSVDADGYRRNKTRLLPGTLDVNIVLDPVVRWTVSVLDGVTGLPLEGAGGRLQQSVWGEEGEGWRVTSAKLAPVAGVRGEYTVVLPKAGRYRMPVGAPDRLPEYTAVTEFDGNFPPAPGEVVLFPAAVLELTVVDAARQPVSGLRVGAVAIPEGMDDLSKKVLARGKVKGKVKTQTTNGLGVARFQLGEGGLVRTTFGKSGWLHDRPLLVVPGLPTLAEGRLAASGDLRVEVVDAQGFAVGGASVNVRSTGKPRPFDLRRSLRVPSGQQSVLFQTLVQCEYDVRVSSRGMQSTSQKVFVAGGGLALTRVVLLSKTEGGGATRPASPKNASKSARKAPAKKDKSR